MEDLRFHDLRHTGQTVPCSARRDSIKHEVYARHLEDEINRSLGYPVLLWNYALTGGGGKIRTSPASWLNYFYWFALNACSWVMSVVILHKSPYDEWAYPVAGLGLIVYVGVIHWWATNKAFTEAAFGPWKKRWRD